MSELLDVLIVGGGPAGACVGALLTRARGATPMRVAILEAGRPKPAAADDVPDLRVLALSRASERILRSAGAWERIPAPRLSPYERMSVWHESAVPEGRGSLTFDAADVGEPNLGYIVESRLVQLALLDAFEAAGGRVLGGALRSLRIEEDCAVVETGQGTLRARLVVGADGARSAVREAVGITAEHSSYRQTALVATVATEHSHRRTAWQRFLSSGTLALLPLADGRSSIVWSTAEDPAQALLDLDPVDFAAELDRASDYVLGETRLDSERVSVRLHALRAHQYVTHRCALVGDAAHVVHPLAGQGVNLALLDAAALGEVLLDARAEREDPGALRILRRYARWRRTENQVMSFSIDAFNRFLAHGSGPLARVAQRGLAWVNASQEARRFFIARALGTAGELPAAARVTSAE